MEDFLLNYIFAIPGLWFAIILGILVILYSLFEVYVGIKELLERRKLRKRMERKGGL